MRYIIASVLSFSKQRGAIQGRKMAPIRRFAPALNGLLSAISLEPKVLLDSFYMDLSQPIGAMSCSASSQINPATGGSPIVDSHSGASNATSYVSGTFFQTTVHNGYTTTTVNNVTAEETAQATSSVGLMPTGTTGVQAITFAGELKTTDKITADNNNNYNLATYQIQADPSVTSNPGYHFKVHNASGTTTAGQTIQIGFAIQMSKPTAAGNQKFFQNVNFSLYSTHVNIFVGVTTPVTDPAGRPILGLAIEDPSSNTITHSDPSFGVGSTYTMTPLTVTTSGTEAVRYGAYMQTGPTGMFRNETDSETIDLSWNFTETTSNP